MGNTAGQPKPIPKPSAIQFIYLSDPRTSGTSATENSAKSHAARFAHARARRQRMLEYEQGKQKAQGPTRPLESRGFFSGESQELIADSQALRIRNALASHQGHVLQPLTTSNPLTSMRKNLFATFDIDINTAEHFLFNHCKRISHKLFSPTKLITAADINIVVPYGQRHCKRYTSTADWKKNIYNEFVPLTLTKPGLFCGLLLSACRNLLESHQDPYYMRLAIVYKLACIRSLNRQLSEESGIMGDVTIVQALSLAADEVCRILIGTHCHNPRLN